MSAQVELMRRARALLANTQDIDKYQDPEFADFVKPSDSWHEELLSALFSDKKTHGVRMPWSKLHDRFELRPGELTIWAGINGHGKSLLLNQVMISVMRQGGKVVIASLELHPVETLARMVCQMSGVIRSGLTEKTVGEFFDRVTDKLWLYSEVGDMTPARVLAMARWSRAELGAGHVVIDSLMKCGTPEGDYAAEKKLVNSLQNVAKQTGLHIHLVAHSRKLKDETQQMGKFDVVGSGMITNMADNVMTVARNKAKEAEKRKPSPKSEIITGPDAFLSCDKQRHGNWEGTAGLWFHESGQFTEIEGRHAPIW